MPLFTIRAEIGVTIEADDSDGALEFFLDNAFADTDWPVACDPELDNITIFSDKDNPDGP